MLDTWRGQTNKTTVELSYALLYFISLLKSFKTEWTWVCAIEQYFGALDTVLNRFKGKNTEVCICLLHTKAGVQELILNQVCQFKVFFYCCLCIMVELIEYLDDSVIVFGYGSNEIVASTIYFRSLDLAYGYWLISRPVSKRRFA